MAYLTGVQADMAKGVNRSDEVGGVMGKKVGVVRKNALALGMS